MLARTTECYCYIVILEVLQICCTNKNHRNLQLPCLENLQAEIIPIFLIQLKISFQNLYFFRIVMNPLCSFLWCQTFGTVFSITKFCRLELRKGQFEIPLGLYYIAASTDPFFCLNWQFQIRTGSRTQSFHKKRASFGKGKNGNICFHGILARALLLFPHVKSQKFDVCMILGIS